MNDPIILSAERQVDGAGSLQNVLQIEAKLHTAHFQTVHLSIDPLDSGWNTPLESNHFRSGCAPVEALRYAYSLITTGKCSAVIIEGTDQLKTKYANNKSKRQRLMNVYGDSYPLTEAYTSLAYEFINTVKTTPSIFKNMAQKLYENYESVAKREKIYVHPSDKWFNYITELYRGVDCANPSVDFSGRIILGDRSVADFCDIPERDRIRILGVGVAETSGDGPAYISEIAAYDHLKRAFNTACEQANVDYCELFLRGDALLEAYTCYPVVPMAFLLSTGIAKSFSEIEDVLSQHEIVVTGGMNFAKAPWNNPALNAFIVMYDKLKNRGARIGAVHGNGGLGYKQGVAIIGY